LRERGKASYGFAAVGLVCGRQQPELNISDGDQPNTDRDEQVRLLSWTVGKRVQTSGPKKKKIENAHVGGEDREIEPSRVSSVPRFAPINAPKKRFRPLVAARFSARVCGSIPSSVRHMSRR